eukprot:scaffold73_cov252-Pinguiococcus_pyrenoidosus.AAC.19
MLRLSSWRRVQITQPSRCFSASQFGARLPPPRCDAAFPPPHESSRARLCRHRRAFALSAMQFVFPSSPGSASLARTAEAALRARPDCAPRALSPGAPRPRSASPSCCARRGRRAFGWVINFTVRVLPSRRKASKPTYGPSKENELLSM